ncbi:MAG: hypothetical protein QGG24_04185 [Vicinamibacterales bacterium]|jgi:hypothetical protein|nr:hypothetical protein [Acidobacteriota bacterium]MDP7294500.1 hypothetical protein [Vicinamibacterales bacterium]MDP7471064.1 hypothetical protein [Vicinamibacterales bacterium]MDP7672808.1 hypothetical protein [Vicinamibacterales bacterium]HJO37172.1 hypothetical protein [Vicinamibacterales bacterium]
MTPSPIRWLFALCAASLALASAGTASAQRTAGTLDPSIAVARSVEILCAPRAIWLAPELPTTVAGSQEGRAKRMFGPGEAVILDAGRNRGLAVGAEFFIRRQYRSRVESVVPRGEMPAVLHTAGWLRIVAVEEEMAIATIAHSCGDVLIGDYIEPFEAVDPPAGSPLAEADYASAARVLFTEEGGYTAGPRRFVVIDHGREDGVVPGLRFTLFREILAAPGLVNNLGEAFAVLVDDRTATVRIFGTADAVYAGDRLAAHR